METSLVEKFKEALQSRRVRSAMPTDLSSAELEQLPADVLERAVFSAKTMATGYLDAMETQIRDLLEPRMEARAGQGEIEGAFPFTAGTNKTTARFELKKVWEALGYAPPLGKEGTIEDLSSDARIDLALQTNVDMARGYGQWRQGQDESVLDLWPCSELYRAEERVKKRDWLTRWRAAAAESGDAAR
jgi:hypothetical protein